MSLEEFANNIVQLSKLSVDEIATQFARADTNGDGAIDFDGEYK